MIFCLVPSVLCTINFTIFLKSIEPAAWPKEKKTKQIIHLFVLIWKNKNVKKWDGKSTSNELIKKPTKKKSIFNGRNESRRQCESNYEHNYRLPVNSSISQCVTMSVLTKIRRQLIIIRNSCDKSLLKPKKKKYTDDNKEHHLIANVP